MSILLFSGKEQPYGLLSNNAVTPMVIDNKKYNSVTEYVYTNLFTTAPEIASMKEHIHRNPYSHSIDVKSQVNDRVFIEAIITGVKARFAQDAKFKADINALPDSSLNISWGTDDENRRLRALYYQLRFSRHNIFFDDKYGEIPFDTVNAVVAGVSRALLDNPHLATMPFSELMRYSIKNAPPNIELVSAITNLDEIVPILKIKLKDKIYSEEIIRFQKHLLDVTLNYILRKNYKYVNPSQYKLAKQQQILKEQNFIPRYEIALFNLYKSEELPMEILNNLEYIPTIPLSSDINIDTIEEQTIEDTPVENLQTLHHMKILDEPPESYKSYTIPNDLLPHAPTKFTIKGTTYTSPVAYAYSVLFEHIGIKITEHALANTSLEKLRHDYLLEEHNVMTQRLTDLNEKATRAKFATDSSLVQLLLTTGTSRLIFSDTDDQILGVGKPSGSNRSGVFLEFIRTEFSTNPPINASFISPYDNIVVKEWFISRASDYANTLAMFRMRNAEDLALIYNIKPEFGNEISNKSSILMNASGLSNVDQKLVMPFMVADFLRVKPLGIKGICNIYTNQQPSQDDKLQAEHTLEYMYTEVKRNLWPNISRKQFVSNILSNCQDCSVKQDQWWRIIKWARIGRLRAGNIGGPKNRQW